MDTTIIAIILGALGFMASIISIVYARQQTKSAKEQVKLLKQEAEKKKNLHKASDDILRAIELIKKSWKVRRLDTLNSFQDKILVFIHDKKIEKLNLKIICEPLHLSTQLNEDIVITSEEMLMEKMKLWADEKIEIKGKFKVSTKPYIGFCERIITPIKDNTYVNVETNFIDVTDLIKEVQCYFIADKIIRSHEDLVRTFDSEYLDENNEELAILIANIINPASGEYELSFSIDESSSEMRKKIENHWFKFDIIDIVRMLMCSKQLEKIIAVQSKIFEMSQ